MKKRKTKVNFFLRSLLYVNKEIAEAYEIYEAAEKLSLKMNR